MTSKDGPKEYSKIYRQHLKQGHKSTLVIIVLLSLVTLIGHQLLQAYLCYFACLVFKPWKTGSVGRIFRDRKRMRCEWWAGLGFGLESKEGRREQEYSSLFILYSVIDVMSITCQLASRDKTMYKTLHGSWTRKTCFSVRERCYWKVLEFSDRHASVKGGEREWPCRQRSSLDLGQEKSWPQGKQRREKKYWWSENISYVWRPETDVLNTVASR